MIQLCLLYIKNVIAAPKKDNRITNPMPSIFIGCPIALVRTTIEKNASALKVTFFRNQADLLKLP